LPGRLVDREPESERWLTEFRAALSPFLRSAFPTPCRTGSILSIGGDQFLLTYAGGDGNDVVLTQLSLLPSLAIERASSSAVRLLWPTNAQVFNLENNTNLAGTNWLSTSPSPTVIGTNNVVTNSTTSGSAKFYRLRKP